MGQKTDPRIFRLALNKDWSSRWYAQGPDFARRVQEDIEIRKLIKHKLKKASVGRIVIERTTKHLKIILFTARPGVVIGKKGEGIEQIKKSLQLLTKATVQVDVEEIRKPELHATLIADQIAQQIEKRIAFRRAMKRAIQGALKQGAQGIKVQTSGRLNGIDIARSEWYREGRVPLHTLRANIDYSTAEATTTYGIIGIKVWVYTGTSKKTKYVEKTPKSYNQEFPKYRRKSIGDKDVTTQ